MNIKMQPKMREIRWLWILRISGKTGRMLGKMITMMIGTMMIIRRKQAKQKLTLILEPIKTN
jgi:hypothetical protein